MEPLMVVRDHRSLLETLAGKLMEDEPNWVYDLATDRLLKVRQPGMEFSAWLQWNAGTLWLSSFNGGTSFAIRKVISTTYRADVRGRHSSLQWHRLTEPGLAQTTQRISDLLGEVRAEISSTGERWYGFNFEPEVRKLFQYLEDLELCENPEHLSWLEHHEGIHIQVNDQAYFELPYSGMRNMFVRDGALPLFNLTCRKDWSAEEIGGLFSDLRKAKEKFELVHRIFY